MSQTKLKNTLVNLYESLPRTGLYDSKEDIRNQVVIFLKYVKFLKNQLYEGPRNICLRRLSKMVDQIRTESKLESDKLFGLMNIDTFPVDFVHLMETYEKESDIQNAGNTYKQYLKALTKSTTNPYTPEKLKWIEKNLQKKYIDTQPMVVKIMDAHAKLQTENALLAQRYEDMLKTDPSYQRWDTIRSLWTTLGFADLAKMYHDLDTDTGNIRSRHGNSLEYLCTDMILCVVAGRCHIPVSELKVIRNILIKQSKSMIGEIDIIVVHGDQIVACIEVKSGIYDISNAMEQLANIKLIVQHPESKTKFLVQDGTLIDTLTDTPQSANILKNKTLKDDALFLVVTTIPQHKPVTGVSFSDLQIISQVLFDKSDRWLYNLVDSLDIDVISDRPDTLDQGIVDKIYHLLSSLRTKMHSQVDAMTAMNILGDNLIIV